MATYTAYCGALRPAFLGPGDGTSGAYGVSAEVLVLDSAGRALMAFDGPRPYQGLATVLSAEVLALTDTLTTMRMKVLTSMRAGVYFPQIKATDTVKAVWLDDGGLLSL